MIKRGKVDNQEESKVASYRYLEVSIPDLQMIGSNECDVSRISEEFLHSTILRSSWNLINMDECAARLEPLTDQYKPIQHQTFEIEIFLDLIVTTRSSPGDKKSH